MALLITEMNERVDLIVEAGEGGKKNYYIEGVIMQSEIQNRNGRVYPKNVLEREIGRFVAEKVSNNRAYGELNHPQGPTINLDRVSHMFTNLRFENNDVVGRAKVIGTPMGEIVKNLIDEGANLGISSRGMGTLKKNSKGIMEVQNDFMLATAGDIVADPSAPNAFVKGILEGVEWQYDIVHGWIPAENAYDEIYETVKEADKGALDEAFAIAQFEKFLKSIS